MRIGEVHLHPVPDGTFVARPRYFGDHLTGRHHPEVFDRRGTARLPIGCFLIRTGDRLVLVDAGLGPERQDMPYGMRLVGGRLPAGLRALGVAPADLTDVICTHLHGDHVGWLFDRDAGPVFGRATIWFGAGDWTHFVTGPGELRPHLRAGFEGLSPTARLRPIDGDTAVAPGVTAVPAPGHTPGHLCVVVASGPERALLLGDAITCPVQLDEPTWHSLGDVDPALADRTRKWLWEELADGRTVGTGAHFPGLRLGRVLPGADRRWQPTSARRPRHS
jgi:glyoxylase-like metal-dependent hydrolase (beta-lactamase superfamily II)